VHLTDPDIEEEQRGKYVRRLATKLFNRYKSDDECISHHDFLYSLNEINLDPN
jgi:hypothetical protein